MYRKMVTHSISLKNIRLYAYHGCLQEEAKIGSHYRVDMQVFVDFSKSAKTDMLSDTLDYVALNRIVKQQMAIRSNLLEHAAQRIIDRIKADFKQVTQIELEVAKLNPPINGDVEAVSVKIIEKIVV